MKKSGTNRAISPEQRVPRFIERSIAVAALLAGIGVAVTALGVYVEGVGGTVIASVGTTLITLAILGVLYEAFLKDVLLREIYEVMEIRQNLQAVDLKAISRKDQIDLSALLVDADEVTVIPLDPASWSHSDWHRVTEHAMEHAMEVRIYLPNHDSPHIDVLAQRLGIGRDELAKQIGRLPDELAESWDQKEAESVGSTLQVGLYSAIPAIGILTTNRRIVLELPPSLGYAPTDRSSLAVVIGQDGWSPVVSDFVADQLKINRIPAFSQSVMRPLKGSSSPDVVAPELEQEDQ